MNAGMTASIWVADRGPLAPPAAMLVDAGFTFDLDGGVGDPKVLGQACLDRGQNGVAVGTGIEARMQGDHRAFLRD